MLDSLIFFKILFIIFCLIFKVHSSEELEKYIVSIQLGGYHFCSGSILNSHAILTAGRCFGAYETWELDIGYFNVQIGSAMRVVDDKMTGVQNYSVQSILIHEHFKLREANADVAIVMLTDDISDDILNGRIVEIAKTRPKPGASCVLFGWGRLFKDGPMEIDCQFIDLNVMSHTECAINALYYIAQICLEPRNSEIIADEADPGSILMCDGKQAGIGQFRFLFGNLYYTADLSYHYDWIMQNNTEKRGANVLLVLATISFTIVFLKKNSVL